MSLQDMIRRARRQERLRQETAPKDCFVISHDYVRVFCDPDMADEYYRRARHQVCFECYWWQGKKESCQKPYGLKHLLFIVKKFLWRLRWKFPPLDRLYCYQFRLSKRKEGE